MRMRGPVRYPAGLKIPAGDRPEADRVAGDGAKVLRLWQRAAFKQLYKKRQRIVVAPTGSGKSTLIMALALKDLEDGRAQKVVVAVPQSIIASSFEGGLRIKLPGGHTVHWEPGHQLFQEYDQEYALRRYVKRLRDFLTEPLGVTKLNPERILICTHAALVAYHQKYHGASQSDWSDYKSVSFNIDEAHHSRCPDDETEESEEDLRDNQARNELGGFIADWLANKPGGTLTLTTATWFRTDRIAIIPLDCYDTFARYTLSVPEYLRGHQHLKEIEIRFLNGKPEDCIGRCHREDPRANTIIYLRPIAQGRDKFQDMDRLLKRLKLAKSDVADLVDPEGRDQRKKELTTSIKKGEWDLKLNGTRKKTYVVALNLGREGFDLPALQRSIVIGPRSSMQLTVQMLGRLLRDHVGKTKVQFNIVLPFLDDDMRNGTLIGEYTKVMLAALALGCVMWPPKFRSAEDRVTYDKVTRNGPGVLAAALAAIAEAVTDDPVEDAEAFVDDLIQKEQIKLTTGCTPGSLSRVLVAILRRQAQAELLERIPDPKLVRDDLAGLRSWRLSFGHGTLTNLCRSVGKYVPFTWEAARKAILAFADNAATRRTTP